MTLDFEKDYTPLREAAEQMGIVYSTAHQYCKKGLLAGAIKFRGTRWLVSNETIKLWKEGKVDIGGAFRKGDRTETDQGTPGDSDAEAF
jgi:hypothetical protein